MTEDPPHTKSKGQMDKVTSKNKNSRKPLQTAEAHNNSKRTEHSTQLSV